MFSCLDHLPLPYSIWPGGQIEDYDRDHEPGEYAEVLIDHLNKELKHDESGRSYFRKESVLNLVFRVADFMRQLSKRI